MKFRVLRGKKGSRKWLNAANPFENMTFVIIILAVSLQIFLSVKKVSPVISLLIVAILTGLFLGMKPMEVVKSVENGVGTTLSGLALILCLGAILGKILESSGAAKKYLQLLLTDLGFRISNGHFF